MNKFQKRVVARKNSIEAWLEANELNEVLYSTNDMLSTLDRNALLSCFIGGIEKGLNHCKNLAEVNVLDFSWYYAGRETGEALAYAHAEVKTTGALAKSDLGPKALPGLEVKTKMGLTVGEYFAAIPTHIALNKYTADIMPVAESLGDDAEQLSLDLTNIWNYLLAMEAFGHVVGENSVKQPKDTLWVMMTSHERLSVPIGCYNK